MFPREIRKIVLTTATRRKEKDSEDTLIFMYSEIVTSPWPQDLWFNSSQRLSSADVSANTCSITTLV
jgi:hypothetical protein